MYECVHVMFAVSANRNIEAVTWVWFSIGWFKVRYLLSIIPNYSDGFHFSPSNMTLCSQTGCWPLQKTPTTFHFYLTVLAGPQFNLPLLSPLIVLKFHWSELNHPCKRSKETCGKNEWLANRNTGITSDLTLD